MAGGAWKSSCACRSFRPVVVAARAGAPLREIVLDMDSSVSPTYGNQELSVWNGHFGCTCYHPLFVFNQFGDLERCALRPGNVHSADGWQDVLEPVVARYQGTAPNMLFRADAAFANPPVYEFLETRQMREKLIKIGAKVVSHGRYVAFQMAEVAVPRNVFTAVFKLIAALRSPPPTVAPTRAPTRGAAERREICPLASPYCPSERRIEQNCRPAPREPAPRDGWTAAEERGAPARSRTILPSGECRLSEH